MRQGNVRFSGFRNKLLPQSATYKFLSRGSSISQNWYNLRSCCGPGSSVGIATGYGLDGRGSNPSGGRDFPHLSRPALGPTQPPVKCVPGLSRGKERPGRDADPSPFPASWSRKSRVIPLLPLWSVRLVQSLSACTRVHFTFTFYVAAT